MFDQATDATTADVIQGAGARLHQRARALDHIGRGCVRGLVEHQRAIVGDGALGQQGGGRSLQGRAGVDREGAGHRARQHQGSADHVGGLEARGAAQGPHAVRLGSQAGKAGEIDAGRSRALQDKGVGARTGRVADQAGAGLQDQGPAAQELDGALAAGDQARAGHRAVLVDQHAIDVAGDRAARLVGDRHGAGEGRGIHGRIGEAGD